MRTRLHYITLVMALAAISSCSKNADSDQMVDHFGRILSGEEYAGSELVFFSDEDEFDRRMYRNYYIELTKEQEEWEKRRCEEYAYGKMFSPVNVTGRIVCEISSIDNLFMFKNACVMGSEEFWAPDKPTPEHNEPVEIELQSSILKKYFQKKTWVDKPYISLLICNDGASIIADRDIFGETAGADLSKYFTVGGQTKLQLQGLDFEPIFRFSDAPANVFFAADNILIPEFVLYTTEPFDSPVNISIVIPVKRILYLTYIRDKRRNPDAQLQLEPITLKGSFTLKPVS